MQDMSRTQRDNIFAQASFQKGVWDVAVKAMTKFELGQLKNQKLNRKHLVSTPEFKQHLLQPLHHLDPEFQQSILQKLVDQEISLPEMKKDAVEFRSLGIVKSAFLRLTNCPTWSEATQKFPAFTSDERLLQYATLDFKQTVPDIFRTFCQMALDSTTSSSSSPSLISIEVDGVKVHVFEKHSNTLPRSYKMLIPHTVVLI